MCHAAGVTRGYLVAGFNHPCHWVLGVRSLQQTTQCFNPKLSMRSNSVARRSLPAILSTGNSLIRCPHLSGGVPHSEPCGRGYCWSSANPPAGTIRHRKLLWHGHPKKMGQQSFRMEKWKTWSWTKLQSPILVPASWCQWWLFVH